MTKNKLSICAIFRNEALYLKEWIEFHLLVGVEKFYLYNNRSDDDYMNILKPYMERNIVWLEQWNKEPPTQLEAYRDCVIMNGEFSEWIAFLDIDEFLWSTKYNKITEALDTFPDQWNVIGVNWKCFGSGGQQEFINKPVIERFTLRKNSWIQANNFIKSIVRMNNGIFNFGDAHYALLPTYSPNGKLIPRSHNPEHDYTILQINHYGSKSREEWVKRQLLGKPDTVNFKVNEQCYIDVQGDEIDDRDIQRFLPQLKEKL